MRLSEWRSRPPHRDAVNAKLNALVDAVITGLGSERDPHCWVAWGEDPNARWTLYVPTPAGLIACFVRVNIPGEGPRVAAKLIRWNRVQVGELGVETQGGHRLLSFQLEQTVMRGVDDEADDVAAFALLLFAMIDGLPPPDLERRRSRGRATVTSRTATSQGTKAAAKTATGGSRRATGSTRAATTGRRGAQKPTPS